MRRIFIKTGEKRLSQAIKQELRVAVVYTGARATGIVTELFSKYVKKSGSHYVLTSHKSCEEMEQQSKMAAIR